MQSDPYFHFREVPVPNFDPQDEVLQISDQYLVRLKTDEFRPAYLMELQFWNLANRKCEQHTWIRSSGTLYTVANDAFIQIMKSGTQNSCVERRAWIASCDTPEVKTWSVGERSVERLLCANEVCAVFLENARLSKLSVLMFSRTSCTKKGTRWFLYGGVCASNKCFTRFAGGCFHPQFPYMLILYTVSSRVTIIDFSKRRTMYHACHEDEGLQDVLRLDFHPPAIFVNPQ